MMDAISAMLRTTNDSFSREACAFQRALLRNVLDVGTRFDAVVWRRRKQVYG